MGEGGAESLFLDLEVQAGGELAGAQHAHRVLPVAHVRIADHPQGAVLQVLYAADVVDDCAVRGTVEQGVDGEVAAERVLPRGAVGVVAGDEEFAR